MVVHSSFLFPGVAAQAEANPDNYALHDWNNTDTVDSEIENRLGRFDVSLSAAAMKQYNVSCNWSKYISMVSDIRTVCPLNNLAVNFTKLYSDSFVSFYISTEATLLTPTGPATWQTAPRTSQLYSDFQWERRRLERTSRGSFTSLSRATSRSWSPMWWCLARPTPSSVMQSAKSGRMEQTVWFLDLEESFKSVLNIHAN